MAPQLTQQVEVIPKTKEMFTIQTFCPVCLKKIHGKVIEEDGKVFLEKTCEQHGFFKILLENDAHYFKETYVPQSPFTHSEWFFVPKKEDWNIIKKKYSTLYLSITSLCNENCKVCYQANKKIENICIHELIYILKKIGKGKKIILFGGEPTVHESLFKIINLIKKSKNIPLLCTNGLKLRDYNYVKRLKESGIEEVCLSFDGFKEEIYEKMRRSKKDFYIKIRALENLKKLKIKTSIYATIAKGVNEDQIPVIINFAIKNKDFINSIFFIELIPFGRFNVDVKEFLTSSDIVKILELNNVTTEAYFIQFRKLLVNIREFLEKLHICPKNLNPLMPGILVDVRNGQIKPVLNFSEIRKYNKDFESRNFFKILKNLIKCSIKLVSIRKIFRMFFLPQSSLSKDRFLKILVGKAVTPFNYIPSATANIEIEKLMDKIIVNANGQ